MLVQVFRQYEMIECEYFINTGARFREINELLYTQPSALSHSQFVKEPQLFEAYHAGFRLQVRVPSALRLTRVREAGLSC